MGRTCAARGPWLSQDVSGSRAVRMEGDMDMKTIDISLAIEKYLGMTQVCVDVALGALAKKLGSKKAALEAWRKIEFEAARRRNARSIVRWNHGGPR